MTPRMRLARKTCRRKACPVCGSKMRFVRYERVTAPGAVQAPTQARCTNPTCVRSWG